MTVIWMNGKLVEPQQATVSIFDHGVLYGDGVFEGLRQYHGRVFRLPDHIKRLYASARAIRLEIPYSAEELMAAINETLQANKLVDAYIRLVVTRGGGSLDISPANCGTPGVFIIAGSIAMYSEDTYRHGMAIITASTPRIAAADHWIFLRRLAERLVYLSSPAALPCIQRILIARAWPLLPPVRRGSRRRHYHRASKA